MRPVAAALVVGFVACASSGGVPEASQVAPVQVGGTLGTASQGRILTTNNSNPSSTTIDASADAIWKVLPGVMDELGIPITVVDPKTSMIGNSGFTARHRLANTSLSRYLECGTTQIGPNADSYDVYISFFTQVHRESDASATIVTGFDASAKPVAFVGNYAPCSSKRLLESRIVDVVKARLKTP